jgi:membrane protein insertase Oxa1/YidC/SpoIIIJ
MKKYLLLIEDEKIWEKFKENITKDINTEIMKLIRENNGKKGGKND